MQLFSKNKWSDKRLVDSIKAGGKLRETATKQLLQNHLKFIYKLHQQLGIEKEAARDALVDAVLAVIEKIEKGRFTEQAQLSTFLYRIFYNKCVDFLRKRSSNKVAYLADIPEQVEQSPSPVQILADKGDVVQLKGLLQKLGSPCQQILLDWGAGGYSMQEIALRSGLANAEKAKRQKYNCLQKLIKLVRKFQLDLLKRDTI
ncbi:MAG: sigma-70 family RNA polymerase sigma factor [Bacteroidota bacterium]